MNKDKLTKNAVIILGIVSLVLLAAQVFVFRDIIKKNQNSSRLSNQVSIQDNKESYMISTGKVIQNKSDDIDRVHRSIVSSTEDVQFIESLESMAGDNNLSIEIQSLNLEENSKSTTSPITTLRISAKTKGGWTGTYKFLKQIESMPVKVRINSYSFVSNTNNSESTTTKNFKSVWDSSVELSVLKYK